MKKFLSLTLILAAGLALTAGCAKKKPAPAGSATPPKHEHIPPHGGTPVVLGDEIYHVELVLDAATGTLNAYVFDGELEEFIRSTAPSFDIVATVNGAPQTLVMKAVANPATGETVGDSSYFTAQADWLKTTKNFDATIKSLTIRGTTFTDVKFNFPKGNDKD